MITYTITLEADDGGPPLEVTAAVRSLDWRLGADDPAQALAPPGSARITVYDPDLRYAPDAADAPLVGRWLTIRSHDGDVERVHFSGMIAAIVPAAGPDERGQAVLHAVTADAGLRELTALLPPVTDATPGQLIAALLADLPLRRPALSSVWVLEAPGFGELDSTARLAASLALAVLGGEGVSRFAYAALGGLLADEALRQVVISEGGRCAVNRSGALVLFDRHQPLHMTPPAAEFDGSMYDLALTAGKRWANQIRARFYPVKVGAPETALWSLERPQKLPPGVRRMTVHFRDSDGQPCAAWSIDRLAASAASAPDETGSPMLIDALIAAADARGAVLEFRNQGPADAWLTPDTRLYGTPLQLGAPLQVEQADWLSMAFHGPCLRELELPLIDSLDEADSRARFELLRAPVPRACARMIELDARAAPSVIGITLGDRITISDSTTGHRAAYDVIGEAHSVDEGGARHRVRLFLDPAPQTRFWETGLCALDAETTLAH